MRVLLKTIAAEGVQIDPAIGFRDFLGRSLASITAHLNAEHGLHLTKAALERMRLELYEVFRAELRPARWVAETLDRLGVRYCVASSSQPERIRLSLAVTGLIDRFEPSIFSASMVARGKPDPDLFLHAAAAMGVKPENCLVVEDSTAGITAAKHAGMRVFAYAGGSHIGPSGLRSEIEALQPDAVFDDMRALPGLVALAQGRVAAGRGTLLVAVDVGTTSARAGIADPTGALLARAEHPIRMRRADANHAEYASEGIWDAVCRAVRSAMGAAGAKPEEVVGISFDATCSLVVRDRIGRPLAVSRDGTGEWDTIAWLDHRALAEAAECTASGHEVIAYFGGAMSPEMQVPKLLWLKRHLPETWTEAGYFFDLADFLTWKASGSLARSQCTLTCKWSYLGHAQPGWPRDFLAGLGLDDLLERGSLPEAATPIGTDLGPLTVDAAAALGLTVACRVGAGLVDAHAGTLGALGGLAADPEAIERHLALIAGTSSCVMFQARRIEPLQGAWGPSTGRYCPACGHWRADNRRPAPCSTI